MIKIIKKGKVQPKKVAWYKIKCPECGCEFYTTEDEFSGIMRSKFLQSDPCWRPPLGEIRCPNEDCELNKKGDYISYILHDALELPEGDEPVTVEEFNEHVKVAEKIIGEKLGIDTEEKETALSIATKEMLINHLKGVAVGITEDQKDMLTKSLDKAKTMDDYHLPYKKLTSKDDHCPKCGKECIPDDITLQNCGWDARYCSLCGHTFYVEEDEEETSDGK